MIHALDRKLLRDFRRLWTQSLAIALVLACGVAILIMSYGMFGALTDSRAAYYERNRFAEVFASAKRAPQSLVPEIANIPGVIHAEARVSALAVLDIEGRAQTAAGQILSLPEVGAPLLNVPILQSGRLPDPRSTSEVAVNAPFAEANGFELGAVFWANLDGQKRPLTIVGTVLSPEFIYSIGPGQLVPDNSAYGIIWMSKRATDAAFDMGGAFNNVSLSLSRDANEEDVLRALDQLLDPYGGTGAYGRDRQQSHQFVDSEITQLRIMSYVLPPIFFGISIFLVNLVVGRIVALERAEIGLLKAIGYSDLEVSVHYLMLAALTAFAGIGIGWLAGAWLTRQMAQLYAEFFNFPFVIYRTDISAYALSAALALATAAIGALRAARAAARLAPAVAMSPPSPPRYERSLIDRALSALRLSQPSMMIFRSLVRWPLRSAFSVLGISLAVAVLVASRFFDSALDTIIESAFYHANRQDAVVQFTAPQPESVLETIRDLPGVMQVEGQYFAAVTLHAGHRSKELAVTAMRPDDDLARIIDGAGRAITPPAQGLILSTRVADQLGLGVGDLVSVEFKQGRRETIDLPVSGTIEQYFGIGAYMELGALNDALRQSDQLLAANITIDSAYLADLHREFKDIPAISGVAMLTDMRRGFQETIAENVNIVNAIYISIAVMITVGVAYNGARIQLSERARELASLRILGFSRGEVSYILVGEAMILAIAAQPLGWLLGRGIAWTMVTGAASDLYSIPLVITAANLAESSLIVLLTAFLAAMVVRRRLDRLDLVSVMKTRE